MFWRFFFPPRPPPLPSTFSAAILLRYLLLEIGVYVHTHTHTHNHIQNHTPRGYYSPSKCGLRLVLLGREEEEEQQQVVEEEEICTRSWSSPVPMLRVRYPSEIETERDRTREEMGVGRGVDEKTWLMHGGILPPPPSPPASPRFSFPSPSSSPRQVARSSAAAAYTQKHRSMLAGDVLDQVGATFHNLFPPKQ
jgi:hypothetical protein